MFYSSFYFLPFDSAHFVRGVATGDAGIFAVTIILLVVKEERV